MKFKKFFLVTCFIICLFTMASACASEVNDTAVSVNDLDDNLKINEDNLVGADSINNDSFIEDSLNELQQDNKLGSAPENTKNLDFDKLKVSEDNIVGENLWAEVSALNVSVADNALFVIDVPDDFKGNVSINVGDNLLYNGSVKTLIETNKLPAGNHVATAVFYGDEVYDNLTLSGINFTVSRVTPTIDVDIGDSLVYPVNFYAIVRIGNNANGTVNVTLDGKKFSGNVSNGEGNVSISKLSAGNKEAKIEFFSSDYYNNNVTTFAKFIIYPNNSLIEVKYNNITYVGDDIQIFINTTNSTGDLKIFINGALYGSSFNSHFEKNYEVLISDKYAGTYNINFRLDGDQNYTGYDTSIVVYVIKNDLTINVTDIEEDICVGRPVTFKAKLSNIVTGNVIFTINGANYTEYVNNADEVTHVYTPVNNETLNVAATFIGNDMYNANVSDSKEFNVNRIATSIDVSFQSSITAGDDLQIFVNMNPEITGTVMVNVGTKCYDIAIVDGSGWYTVSNLFNDVLDVQVEFAGDDKYAGCTSEVGQVYVNKIFTNLNIGIDKTSMGHNDTAVVSIDLNQSMNAVVTLKVNGRNNTVGLVNGKGSFTLYGLDKDNYTINAVYAGDDRFVGCISNTLNLTVTGDEIPTSVFISMNKYSVFVDEEVIIKINLNPIVTGVVRLNIGSDSYNVAVNKGVGSFKISNLPNGTYNVQAIFDGDNIHSGNSSDVVQLEVNKIPTNFSMSIDNPSVVVGDNVIITVNSNQAVTGVIRLNIGSDSYDVVVNKGVGSFKISDLANGIYNVQAIFDGDDKYLGNSSEVKQLEVKKIPTNLSVSVDNSSVFVGDSVVVGVVLNQFINNVVTINVNDKDYLIGIVNGRGNLTLSGLAYGTYSVNATFAEDGKYAQCNSNNVTLEVNKIDTELYGDTITATYNVNKYLVITLKDTKGNPISKANVVVNLNGAKTFTTDNNGQIKVPTSGLAPKTYTAKITFDGNAIYGKSSKDVKVTVKKATPNIVAKAKTFKVNVKTKKYSITLNDNVGKAIKKATVYLTVKGKTYKAITDSKGKATFNIINLKKKGNYNVVITYKGNDFYNKLSKKAKIKVS